DDDAPRLVYADWLDEHDDPERAEFIRVQIALEDPKLPAKQRKDLAKREQALLRRHERTWLGALAPARLDADDVPQWQVERGLVLRHRFARGWLDELQVPDLDVALGRLLAGAPEARLLRRLTVLDQNYDEPGIDALRESDALANVRTV